MKTTKSKALFQAAQQVLVGGVNSPVRAFQAVGGTPLFIDHAAGAHLYDVDGNRYIDYVGSWGPMILGHNHPQVRECLEAALKKGTSFGAPTELEIRLAEKVRDCFPAMEKIRFVNSGTEATMSALRAARGFAGRPKIIKLEGCYHGHADSLLVKAGSGATTLGIPSSAGVPSSLTQDTLIAPYNDIGALERIMAQHPKDIAALILEPAAGNMGFVPPAPHYLSAVRDLTAQAGVVLIFDEVMTGFRLARGGAQALYHVIPDLTCLGKVIGGGLPVGAYGGRAEIMKMVAPEGPVYQAGTLSGNPLAMAAGLATLEMLAEPDFYPRLHDTSQQLFSGLKNILQELGLPFQVQHQGPMGTLFFADRPITNYATALTCDTTRFARFFQALLTRGIYWPPSQFEALFISAAHTERDLADTLAAAREALQGKAS